MKNLLKNIGNNDYVKRIIEKSMGTLFVDGAIDNSILEVLSWIKLFRNDIFEIYENQILIRMGLFYKELKIETFNDLVFKIYWDYVKETYNNDFTPVQADIIDKIENNQAFAFSSPTSTGKSFVFRYLINQIEGDMVFIVPSRALINEYYNVISKMTENENINVLTFVDIINKKHAKRNIFIVTPERTRDLFILNEELNVKMILFDEAQLSDDNNIRGMYYDSVVRRAVKYFKNSRFVFAYPFISNPSAQYIKNKILIEEKDFSHYDIKNVGQMFFSYVEVEKGGKDFYIYGTDVKKTGTKTKIEFDPLEKTLIEGGTALIYCAKTHIYNRKIIRKFHPYLKYCRKIDNPQALAIINEIRKFIGAKDTNYGDYVSLMILLMKRGIVLHHGSLPLRVRNLIEEFTQKGYAKVCFATATLEQGINMPFDLVWIEKFQPSRELDVKNLIGRAGRSTLLNKFDFGQVVIKDSSRTQLSNIVKKEISVNEISELDSLTDPNDDYREYKEAIKNNTFSEEYNLTNSELERIENTTYIDIENILEISFLNNELDLSRENITEDDRTLILQSLKNIYKKYLLRGLTEGEEAVLSETVRILYWRIQGQKFNQIVNNRYNYSSQISERNRLKKIIEQSRNTKNQYVTNQLLSTLDSMDSLWITMFQMIPNKNIYKMNINYDSNSKKPILAKDVDFDRIVVDTYDYLDKLIGFRLGDVYFAAFDKYSKNENFSIEMREKAQILSKHIKYGTSNEKEIWILRYGFDFEDIEWLSPVIKHIDEKEIIFDDVSQLNDNELDRIKKFMIK